MHAAKQLTSIKDDSSELKGQVSEYVDVPGIRALNQVYRMRRGVRGDWTSVPHSLASGVAHATSSLAANLKGGLAEDGPLRRRELRPDLSASTSADKGSGRSLIVMGDLGGVTPPDVITDDLELYTRTVMRTKEKDQNLLGARRVGDLWRGAIFEMEGKRGLGGFLGRKNTVKDGGTDEDSDEGGRPMRGLARTGQAIKGLVGSVSLRRSGPLEGPAQIAEC